MNISKRYFETERTGAYGLWLAQLHFGQAIAKRDLFDRDDQSHRSGAEHPHGSDLTFVTLAKYNFDLSETLVRWPGQCELHNTLLERYLT